MQRAAAEARARGYARLFSALISEGFVNEGDIARELNTRGAVMTTGSAWTKDRVRVVLRRLVALGIVTFPSSGPYGSRRYRLSTKPGR
jgi:hypothetical protein